MRQAYIDWHFLGCVDYYTLLSLEGNFLIDPFKMTKETPNVPPAQATTLTGKPIQQYHDHFTSTMMAESAAPWVGNAGANLLPPGYTDKSLVRIPIRMSDVDPNEMQPAKKKGGFFRKLSSSGSSSAGEMKVVMMSRRDYLKYWAKGDDGKFLPSVEEPPEGRKEWYRQQLELNEEWKRNDPSLGKPAK